MSEIRSRNKKLHDYRQLTVRVESNKFKKLKMQLIEKEITLQDWVNAHLDTEISLREKEKHAA